MKTILLAAIAAALCSAVSAQETTKPLSPEAIAVLKEIQKSIQIKAVPLVEENKKHMAAMEADKERRKAMKIAEEKARIERVKHEAELDAEIENIRAGRSRIIVPSRPYVPMSDALWLSQTIRDNACGHR